MRKNKHLSGDSGSPLRTLLLFLLSSCLGGLLFSILALRAKRKQKTVFWWFLLSLIFIAIFGFLSYTLVLTSSPTKDSSYYYLGMVSLVSNSFALIILIATLFSKNSNDKVE
jgi:hypothetical protein